MQTAIPESIRSTPDGREADSILRACVHCGFCNATCPTFQLLGDELDGPRGRIYLIKQMLEGAPVSRRTLTHLDRCLTCRNCETTCPSGVRYGRLLEIGREQVEERVQRPWHEQLARWLLRKTIPYPERFAPLLRVGQLFRPLLPGAMKQMVPRRGRATNDRLPVAKGKALDIRRSAESSAQHARKMLLLAGCVQPAIAPSINFAAARVLDGLGISLIEAAGAGCCGAVCHHTSGVREGLEFARRNIDAWWPYVDSGIEAIVMTASGCGVHVKEYGHLLRDDPAYADKARRVSELTRDLSEILAREDLSAIKPKLKHGTRVAFQSPCTLQHGQKLGGVVEKVLRDLGIELAPVPEAHLCCGAAGTYSLLQPELSQQLRNRKIAALTSGQPLVIATANIGCLAHLQAQSPVPVLHWIELLAE